MQTKFRPPCRLPYRIHHPLFTVWLHFFGNHAENAEKPETQGQIQSLQHQDIRVLSADEKQRGARLVSKAARLRFWEGRAFLRRVLGFYAGCSAGNVVFCYNDQGKPSLCPTRHEGLQVAFNASHTTWLYAVAVSTKTKAIGLDIEALANVQGKSGLWPLVCSPSELAYLQDLGENRTQADKHQPCDRQTAAADTGFLRLWTRKEALLKALGTGFGQDPRHLLSTFCDTDRRWRFFTAPGPQAHHLCVALRTE